MNVLILLEYINIKNEKSRKMYKKYIMEDFNNPYNLEHNQIKSLEKFLKRI